MKLTELEPFFIGEYQTKDSGVSYRQLASVDGAQGILFICPKCGNHSILCWFKNPRNAPLVPDEAFPRPGRWTLTGDTFDVLTLSPSIDLSVIDENNPKSESRCYWHGFVENGDVR
jgi:hypothetical protein